MPLSPPAPREHIHSRQVHCLGYERNDGLWDIEGHLVDVKTYELDTQWRGRLEPGDPIHEMWLRITIDTQMNIHAAEAVTDKSPYPMCPDITPAFKKLAGLRIGPGWTREVSKRVGGVRGCTHLVELLRPLATTAFQTLVKARAMSASSSDPARRPPLLNTCHAHASDSAVTKSRWPAFYTGD